MKYKRHMAVFLICLFSFTLFGCSKKAASEEETVKPVKAVKVKMEDYSSKVEISGNVKPAKLIKSAFKVPGVISDIYVKEGDMVSAGQPLLKLESSDYELNVEASKAQYDSLSLKSDSSIKSAVNQAKANLDYVQTQCGRVRRLYEKGAVAKKTVEELETGLVVAQNKYQEALDASSISEEQLKQARAAWELAQSKLEDTILRSPIDGTVVKKIAEQGESTAAGYPVIVLGTLDDIEVEIGVSDSLLEKITEGQKVNVFIYGLDKEVEGTIKTVEPAADTQTRTFPVKIGIENKDGLIKPGMVAKVSITTNRVQSVMAPVDSVIKYPDGTKAFVCSQDGVAEERKVEIGEVLGDKIQIVDGLKEGELLVVEGQYKLRDGDKTKMEVVEQ